MRKLGGFWAIVVDVIALAASVFHIYTAAFGLLEPRLQRGFHLLFLLPLAFLLYPRTKKSPTDCVPLSDALLAFWAFLPSVLIVIDNERLTQRWEHVTPLLFQEWVLGIIAIILVIEAVRRAVTPVLAYVVIAALAFMALGPILPGVFHHHGITAKGIVEMMYLLADEGIYGMITGISAMFIFIFVVYG